MNLFNQDCKCCKVLSEQLELANREKMRLLEMLLERIVPPIAVEVPKEAPDFQPIKGFKPWRVKQMELEKIERTKAGEARKAAAEPDDPEIVKLEELVLSETK